MSANYDNNLIENNGFILKAGSLGKKHLFDFLLHLSVSDPHLNADGKPRAVVYECSNWGIDLKNKVAEIIASNDAYTFIFNEPHLIYPSVQAELANFIQEHRPHFYFIFVGQSVDKLSSPLLDQLVPIMD